MKRHMSLSLVFVAPASLATIHACGLLPCAGSDIVRESMNRDGCIIRKSANRSEYWPVTYAHSSTSAAAVLKATFLGFDMASIR